MRCLLGLRHFFGFMSTLTIEQFHALVKPKKKANKYGVSPKNERTYRDRLYSSKLEMKYAQKLDLWKSAGAVSEWWPQVTFVLHANGGEPIGRYICDFRVLYTAGHTQYVEVKGFDVPLGKWKRRHAEAEYKIKIDLVRKISKTC